MRATKIILTFGCLVPGPDRQVLAEQQHQGFRKRPFGSSLVVRQVIVPRKYSHPATLQQTGLGSKEGQKQALVYGSVFREAALVL